MQEERRCKTTWFQEHASHFLKRKVLRKNLKGWFIPRKTLKKMSLFSGEKMKYVDFRMMQFRAPEVKPRKNVKKKNKSPRSKSAKVDV